MANAVKYFEGTEEQILALQPGDANWVERAFYYPTDKTYFYRVYNDVLVKYGETPTEDLGVGIRLDGQLIGGVKSVIELTETLEIPENWEYNVHRLEILGTVISDGTINIM